MSSSHLFILILGVFLTTQTLADYYKQDASNFGSPPVVNTPPTAVNPNPPQNGEKANPTPIGPGNPNPPRNGEKPNPTPTGLVNLNPPQNGEKPNPTPTPAYPTPTNEEKPNSSPASVFPNPPQQGENPNSPPTLVSPNPPLQGGKRPFIQPPASSPGQEVPPSDQGNKPSTGLYQPPSSPGHPN